jgi:methyltransferase (TIGR00027 family)
MAGPRIANVSETARWLAAYRSAESARADALFRDRFAERFAHVAGSPIVASAPLRLRNGWPIVVRTKLIDDLVLGAVAEGCDCVVNLAAGFDTRPYRLALPATLAWNEADLPDIVAEKERALAAERPDCRLTRTTVDVADAAQRAAFLSRSTAAARRALVITEGLLVYLDDAVVRALAADLAAQAAVHWWVLDLASPTIADVIRRGMGEDIAEVPLRFAPPDGVGFFEALGWRTADVHSLFGAAVRFRRVPFFVPAVPLAEADPRGPGSQSWAGVVRLVRAGCASSAL